VNELAVIGDALLCGIDDWIEIMGDPLLSGTILMLSYGVTGLLILRAAPEGETRERWYWRACGFLFMFQMLNTHLDLHALIWTSGRCLAHAQGWYESRGEVQLYFLIAVAVLGVLVLCIIMIYFLRNIAGNMLLTLGVGIALGFSIVKGINYHALDQLRNARVGLFYVADSIEFSGIVLAFTAAVIKLRNSRPEPVSSGRINR
jgi:hypothetical protein